MTSGLFSLLLSLECPFAAQAQPPSSGDRIVSRTTAIEFYVGDFDGKEAPYKVQSFHAARLGAPELASRFRRLSIKGIPEGRYEYTLVPEEGPSWGRTLTGTLGLYSELNWITLPAPGTDLDMIDYSYLTGHVKPVPSGGGPLWIRFQSVLGKGQAWQSKIQADGSFRTVWGPLSGNFLLMVCRGDEVLFTRTMRLFGYRSRNIEVELPAGLAK